MLLARAHSRQWGYELETHLRNGRAPSVVLRQLLGREQSPEELGIVIRPFLMLGHQQPNVERIAGVQLVVGFDGAGGESVVA